jgi:hypothetical protein
MAEQQLKQCAMTGTAAAVTVAAAGDADAAASTDAHSDGSRTYRH